MSLNTTTLKPQVKIILKSQAKIAALTEVFDQVFLEKEHTRLQFGADEPFYQAPKEQQPAIIFAREDYFSSALHEIAHWTIAGDKRRKLDDFGYWYEPEGRSAKQQAIFEQVEVKPQAIEWLLSLACEHQFHYSADNLTQGIEASESFKQAVKAQAESYLQKGLPPRAQLLFDKLNEYFRAGKGVTLVDV